MTINLIGDFPLWAMFIVIVIAILCALLTGFKFGSRAAKNTGAAASTPPIGSVVAAMLGLLAFLLALTFNASSARYETRKQLLLEDTNAIATAFYRSDFLDDQDRSQAKDLLREYVDLRISLTDHPEQINETLARTKAIQKQLWGIATSYPKAGTSGAYPRKFDDSLTLMFELHKKRVIYGVVYRIHSTVWMALLLVGLLALGALGFQFGISGGTRYQISFLLAICFGAILLLILDLERPAEGTIRVDPLPLIALRLDMN